MPKGLFHVRYDDHEKPKKQQAACPFPVDLIDQLLARVENEDAESILGENGLADQLKKMLVERMLSAELSHHLANEGEDSKNHSNGSSPEKVLTPGGELNLDIPRDRLSSFEPKLVAQHQRRMSGFDDHVTESRAGRPIPAGWNPGCSPPDVAAADRLHRECKHRAEGQRYELPNATL